MALWLLIPDKDDSGETSVLRFGAFTASCLLFFLAEIGDKTQIATVILSASFAGAMLMVIVGTTLGMLAANVPVVYAGDWLLKRIPLHIARYTACAVFMLLGLYIIVAG